MLKPEKSVLLANKADSAWNFASMDTVWNEFRPLTPYGKDYVFARSVHTDPSLLAEIYEDTEQMAKFYESRTKTSSEQEKLSWHLSRIPRLPTSLNDSLDIFLIKKFLSNYSALGELLDEESRQRFGFDFYSNSLLEELNKGGSDSETFFIASSYDNELEAIRIGIREISEKLALNRKENEERITRIWGVDFKNREFLTIPMDLAKKISAQAGKAGYPALAIESFDDSYCLMRPLPDEAALELQRQHALLREKEAIRERAVLQKLFKKIGEELDTLETYTKVVKRLDLARARYFLKKQYGLQRPDFNALILDIRKGRFIPLEKECISTGRTYTPLSMRSERPVAVLFGSNMGGKTIVLRTVIFLQLMAQTGLGVPAEVFRTRIFDSIRYVGDNGQDIQKGLSGFGMEIHALTDIIETAKLGTCLCAFDEFAHSTSSDEAEALLSAVVAWFSRNPENKVLFATHFRRIARTSNVDYYAMAGLDVMRAEQIIRDSLSLDSAGKERNLIERIRMINDMMRYVVCPERSGEKMMEIPSQETESGKCSDALAVASLLGLEPEIIQLATNILKEKQV